MKPLCIVPCGRKKIWDKYPTNGPTPAKDAYIGNFSRICQEYARVFYLDSYYILSAKYGFLHPEDILPGSYDVTFKKPKTNPISIPELRIIAQKKCLYDFEPIIVVADSIYSQVVCAVFTGKVIIEPLKGCRGNGEMMGKLRAAIRNNKPLVP